MEGDENNVSSEIPEKFLVAFSFAGEQRDLVQSIATAVQERLGEGTVFFDEWYEYYIAGSDADLKLQKIYHERSVLVVLCVSSQYGNKPWTRAEYEAIRALKMQLSAGTKRICPDPAAPCGRRRCSRHLHERHLS